VTPERWAQIEELFHRAADCRAEDRDALLNETGHCDPELSKEVEALLACAEHAPAALQATVDAQMGEIAFPLVGQVISHYQILGGIGGGGMGLVYSAEDIKLGRRVAIKFLPENSAQDPSALRRFELEARSASALEHPNICPIYEFGEHEGQPFLVMPMLAGRTLQELLSESEVRPPMKVLPLLDLAIGVCKGLEAAHGRGIIHRDIKPGNIFVAQDGQPKILDFGLAKLTDAVAEKDSRSTSNAETVAGPSATHASLSQTGSTVGTVAYMSPEQIRGERLDVRTDLFSFGLILYEMATGKRPFHGDDFFGFQQAVLTQTPMRVRSSNPEIPTRLDEIIRKAIEKTREARYQSASDLRAELEDLRAGMEPKSVPIVWAVASAAVVVLLAIVMIALLRREPKTISSAPEIKLRQLTTNSAENPVLGGTLSPDGKYLAYSDLKGMHLKLVDSGETREIPHPQELQHRSVQWEIGPWFPDGTRFVANAHPAVEEFDQRNSEVASLWMVSLQGVPIKLRDHAVVWSVTPDGASIIFGTNKGHYGEREVWRMGSDGSQANKLYDAGERASICCLFFWPDGKREIFLTSNDSGDTMVARELKDGAPIVPLLRTAEMKEMNDIIWLPDGRLMYSLRESESLGSACNYWIMRLNFRTGERVEKPRRLTNWPNLCVSSGGVTRDGKRLAFLGWAGNGTSYIADLDAGGTRIHDIRHFALDEGDAAASDWSPDGKWALVAVGRGDRYDLYRQSVTDDVQVQIATSISGGLVAQALFSPDQKWIIALVWPVPGGPVPENPDVPYKIVRIPATGGKPELIFEPVRPGPMSCAKFSSTLCVVPEQTHDGKQMIVTAFDPVTGRGPELARFDLTEELHLQQDNLICALSPDGTRLAISRGRSGPIEIHSLRDKRTQILRAPGLSQLLLISWAPDGSGFFVTRGVQSGSELLHLDFRGETKSLRKCLGRACFATVSPNSRHLAFYDVQQKNNMWLMENF